MPVVLAQEHCQVLDKGCPALGQTDIELLLPFIPEWRYTSVRNQISRAYNFSHYFQTIAFVNAVAWIAHQQDHHPQLIVSFRQCEVIFTTHSVAGLSRNDFICAAKVDTLVSTDE